MNVNQLRKAIKVAKAESKVIYIVDTYMFGVIENDRERKSSDFHVSFYYRG